MQMLWAGRGKSSTPVTGVYFCIGKKREKPGATPGQNGRITKSGNYRDPKLPSGTGSGSCDQELSSVEANRS